MWCFFSDFFFPLSRCSQALLFQTECKHVISGCKTCQVWALDVKRRKKIDNYYIKKSWLWEGVGELPARDGEKKPCSKKIKIKKTANLDTRSLQTHHKIKCGRWVRNQTLRSSPPPPPEMLCCCWNLYFEINSGNCRLFHGSIASVRFSTSITRFTTTRRLVIHTEVILIPLRPRLQAPWSRCALFAVASAAVWCVCCESATPL